MLPLSKTKKNNDEVKEDMDKRIKELLEGRGGNYIFPFFWQHGESEEVLRRYVDAIDKSNIKAFCVESRPHPDFCGEQWWHDMDIILDEARRRAMKVWILDDSHFPTGYANGAMERKPDGLCRQSICHRFYDLAGKEKLYISKEELAHPDKFQKSMVEQYVMQGEQRVFDDDRILAVYAVRMDEGQNGFRDRKERIDLTACIKDGELEWKVPEGQWKTCLLHLSRNFGYHRNYINMMDQDSCRVLIDAVYEPHYAHYKNDFGKTIAGFFSDEPELGNGHLYEINNGFGTDTDFPWSKELEVRLEKEIGKDYAFYMAALWEDFGVPEIAAKVRYLYMNAVTELVKEDFSFQIGRWCREHGVQYIGHLIEDDNHHAKSGSSLGHYFRGLAGQDMAGIDDIGGQVFPQGEEISYNKGVFQHRNGEFYHYILGKLGSSAAAIEPLKKGNSMCEIFGNYGWAEGVRLEKYLADHFLVRGINHFVPHAFSAKQYPDPDCPPHFYAHGNNPQYRHFGCLMSYMNRVCSLISGGRHIASTAVLYHAEGEWTGRYETADKIGHVLADAQIEYDIIPQDVFQDKEYYHTSVSDGFLRVNTQNYKAVIVPYMQYITKALAEAVIEMTSQGIPVLFTGDFPEGICDTAIGLSEDDRKYITQARTCCQAIGVSEIVQFLKKRQILEIELAPANERIRCLHYVHESGMSVWMFVNEGTECYRGYAAIQGLEPRQEMDTLYGYDAWENCIRPLQTADGKLLLEIEPLKSRIVVADSSAVAGEPATLQREEPKVCGTEKPVVFMDAWKRSICKSIDYPAFTEEKEVMLPDRLEKERPDFAGFVRYQNRFEAKEGAKLCLEITDACEGVEVFLNGESLGIQIVPVFRYDLTKHVRTGINELAIEIATTLERENAGTPDVMGQIAEAKSRSGITGEIFLWKGKEKC